MQWLCGAHYSINRDFRRTVGRASRSCKIALHRASRAVNKLVVDERLSSIATPKIDSGAEGIDWLKARGIMDSHLNELFKSLFGYVTALDGMLASEPRL